MIISNNTDIMSTISTEGEFSYLKPNSFTALVNQFRASDWFLGFFCSNARTMTLLLMYSRPQLSAIQENASCTAAPFFTSPALSTMSDNIQSAVCLLNLPFLEMCAMRSAFNLSTCFKIVNGRFIKTLFQPTERKNYSIVN